MPSAYCSVLIYIAVDAAILYLGIIVVAKVVIIVRFRPELKTKESELKFFTSQPQHPLYAFVERAVTFVSVAENFLAIASKKKLRL